MTSRKLNTTVGRPALRRCEWVGNDPLMIAYHDTEWGVPLHDDRLFFEAIILDGAQAGLSWLTVLRRREAYRRAFHRFDPAKVARYGARDLKRLLGDSGIIRNRMKIASAVNNARHFLEVQQEFGTFDRYIWRFVGGRTIRHRFRADSELPARTEESETMSRDLRARGFTFVGPTICYAMMQATGMVNDHITGCFRYRQV